MALDFPASPTNGQVYQASNGQRWQYESSSSSWKALGIAADISLTKNTPGVYLSTTASGQSRGVAGLTSGVLRWSMSLGDATAESGSNAGSDFTVARYSDAGASLATALTIKRSDGLMTATGNFVVSKSNPTVQFNKTASGQAAGFFGYTNTLTRWGVQVGNANSESGSNAGSDFSIDAYNDAGSFLFTPISITRSTGIANFSSHPTVGSASYACRAWVNFNGTGTASIRASANVTSMTDFGTGDFEVNFTTAMSDVNYACVASGDAPVNTAHCQPAVACSSIRSTFSTSAVAVAWFVTTNSVTRADPTIASVAVFR